MANLGIAGAFSLQTMNQWISVINTNLTNSKRIGYKETRVSFSSGEVSSTGSVQTSGRASSLSFPSASLEIGKTQILDYVQGNLTPTGVITDFALNGSGYFVVEDKFGEKYATRDGQFNFDTEGYLVTAEGLRVLTTGMDYVRVPASEQFSVNGDGESQSLGLDPSNINSNFNPANNVSSLSQSIYGTKKLLVIDIPTESKLMYSKYGFTKFQLGNRIPIRIQNDFSKVTDGINTALIPDSLTGFPNTKMADYFKHDLKNGTLKMATHAIGGTQNRYVQAAVTGQRLGDFNFATDFHIRDASILGTTNETAFGITFGKSDHSSTDNDSYFVGLIDNQLVLRKNGVNITTTTFNDATADLPNATSLNDANKFTLKVDVVDGVLTARFSQNNGSYTPVTISAPISNYQGYMSIGNTKNPIVAVNPGGVADNVFDITNLSLVERNRDSEYVTNIFQKNIKDDLKNGINDKVDNSTTVIQQSVEESTSTLADTLPMLSTAQKMFGAVSKIISVYNSMTDDTNALLR